MYTVTPHRLISDDGGLDDEYSSLCLLLADA